MLLTTSAMAYMDADTLTINELNAKTEPASDDLFLLSQTADTNYYKMTWGNMYGAVKDSIYAKITNAWINSAAAIAYSKLNLSNSILNADINTSAAIAYSKLNLSNSILNADINSAAAIAYSKLNLANSITTGDIVNGTIVNEDLSATAAINISKLEGTSAGYIIIGDATGDPVYSSVSGDVTINFNGATAIGAKKVLTSMINNGAVTSIQLGDTSVSTAKIKDANVTSAKLANAITIQQFTLGVQEISITTFLQDNTLVIDKNIATLSNTQADLPVQNITYNGNAGEIIYLIGNSPTSGGEPVILVPTASLILADTCYLNQGDVITLIRASIQGNGVWVEQSRSSNF